MDFDEAHQAILDLEEEFGRENTNIERAQKLIASLKKTVVTMSFLRPSELTEETLKDAVLARETFEYATLLSIKSKDISSFERNFSQVKSFYFDFGDKLEESPRMPMILGLNLLRLLSAHRIAEFHTELELIPYTLHENVFIRHPIHLEQYLMEGSYNKVLDSRHLFPAPSYSYFMDLLVDTVRAEIADCVEKAYLTLPCEGARKMLLFANNEELLAFSDSREWVHQGDQFVFEREVQRQTEIPAKKLVQRTLAYAKELERIV